MPEADFTYQMRRLPGDPAVGIEDYAVYSSDGSPVGTVGALLDRAGTWLLVIEQSFAPLIRRRAVSWEQVDRVDHDALGVWLLLDKETFEREALVLDPAKAVEEGEAEARRVTRLPEDLIPPPQRPVILGPVDRSLWARAFGVFALLGFSTLVATMVVFYTGDNTWAVLFAVPAALAGVAAWLGYRAYRAPYEPRGERKP